MNGSLILYAACIHAVRGGLSKDLQAMKIAVQMKPGILVGDHDPSKMVRVIL